MPAQERTAADAISAAKSKLAQERDEAQRKVTAMLQHAAQYQHEIRKKEREHAKMQVGVHTMEGRRQR